MQFHSVSIHYCRRVRIIRTAPKYCHVKKQTRHNVFGNLSSSYICQEVNDGLLERSTVRISVSSSREPTVHPATGIRLNFALLLVDKIPPPFNPNSATKLYWFSSKKKWTTTLLRFCPLHNKAFRETTLRRFRLRLAGCRWWWNRQSYLPTTTFKISRQWTPSINLPHQFYRH